MRTSRVVGGVTIAALSSIMGVIIVRQCLAHGEGDSDLVVERPSWMRGRDHVAASESAGIQRVRLETEPQAPIDRSPVESLLPVTQLSADMMASEQKIAFQVEAPLDGVVSDAVAAEMVDAASKHWAIFDSLTRLAQADKLPAAKACDLAMMDFFFAIWPDLGTMVRDGKTKLTVNPVANGVPGARVQTGCVFYTLNVPDRRLSVSFHTPSWRVSAKFDEASCGGESAGNLFRTIFTVNGLQEANRK